MRRLALLATAAITLMLTASPAAADHSSDPIVTADGHTVHWKQSVEGGDVRPNGRVRAPLERRIHVIVPAQYASDGLFMRAVNHAVVQGDRSPYIDMILDVPNVAPTDCPVFHCILVTRAPINGGIASLGWDSQGHMYGLAVRVTIDSAPWEQNSLENALCHEVAGHGLGLAHSSHGTQGPCVHVLTDHDLELINTAHAHKDGGQPYGAGRTSGRVWHTESHSRAFYRNLG